MSSKKKPSSVVAAIKRQEHRHFQKRRKQVVAQMFKHAVKVALIYVEQEARSILKNRPKLEEFIMGMGTAFFTERSARGGQETVPRESPPGSKALCKFIEEWDDLLHLTGWPMRFTARGPKITEW